MITVHLLEFNIHGHNHSLRGSHIMRPAFSLRFSERYCELIRYSAQDTGHRDPQLGTRHSIPACRHLDSSAQTLLGGRKYWDLRLPDPYAQKRALADSSRNVQCGRLEALAHGQYGWRTEPRLMMKLTHVRGFTNMWPPCRSRVDSTPYSIGI